MKQAFLFSGQGAQYTGMGLEYAKSHAWAKAVFDCADEVLGRSISRLCFEGSEQELALTHNTQPCIFVVDYAIFQAAREEGKEAEGYAGLSLGEYVALAAGGVLSFEDALRLVQKRADAMQNAVPVGVGAMAALKSCPENLLDEAIRSVGGNVWPANFNSPRQTVISGETAPVTKVVEYLKERHVRAVVLPVSAPFHTPMLEPARKVLEAEFSKITWHDAKRPIYLNVDAMPHTKGEGIKALVLKQTVSPVKWMHSIKAMIQDGFDTFLEMGPGHALSSFGKAINDDENVVFSTF